LPDYVESARLDGIAVAGEIETLLDRAYEALLRRDEVEVVRLLTMAKNRAGQMKEINRKMKRDGRKP